ncbi:hypothetical protein BKA63DRAFT_488032 [Paraphoma chrysanthemicola]|nr:hypothetical protein BKA63DRAFT_488032 [Paraphoma chrysanthemicola]
MACGTLSLQVSHSTCQHVSWSARARGQVTWGFEAAVTIELNNFPDGTEEHLFDRTTRKSHQTGPISETASHRPEHAAKIQVPSERGAGAPVPGPTAGDASRPAAALRAYHQVPQSQPSPPLQQPSPLTQPSPSTVEASPLQTPGPSASNGSAQATSRRPEGRMRAQIACARCRRSKTKCDNQGVGSICKSCAINNKDCQYIDAPAPQSGGGDYHRRESAPGDVDIPPKKRKRLAPTSSASHSLSERPRVNEDFLDSPMLTPKVWSELFDVYEKHFASDFSFLHRRRFLGPFLQGTSTDTASPNKASGCSPRPPHSAPLLLAFLTVTARYHNDLMSQLRLTSVVIAQQFADATRKSLGDVLDGRSSLELAQALLFLAFHEFTDFQGSKGWYKLVIATRMVQNLDYGHDESSKGADVSDSNDELARSEAFINREIQRRTLWSCFIMDRLMSCGKKRPRGIHLEDLEGIQLPCSHMAFIRGIKVRTRHLRWSDEEYTEQRKLWKEASPSPHRYPNGSQQDAHHSHDTDRVDWEYGDREGELSLYIQAINHFGDVTKWSINTSRREYVAFSPWSTEAPCGPLDEPRITEQPDDPEYWVKQAKDMFGAAKQFADLLKACRSADALVDSPVAGWTTYIVAWSGASMTQYQRPMLTKPALYCHFFPKMDPDRALDSRLEDSVWATTNDILVDLEARFKMANHWLFLLVRLHDYYKKERKRWKAHACGTPGSNSSDGGGLRDYSNLFESDHKEFGSLTRTYDSKPVNRGDFELQHYPDGESQTETPSPAVKYKSEGTPSTWTTVNPRAEEIDSSEARVGSAQNQAYSSRGQYSNVTPDYAGRPSKYGSHEFHSLQSPMQGHAAPSSDYYASSATHSSVVPTMYGPANLATRTGFTTVGYLPAQQGNQVASDPEAVNEMLALGHQTYHSADVLSWQIAENSSGNSYGSFSVPYGWMETIPSLPYGQTDWNAQGYDGNHGQMGPK